MSSTYTQLVVDPLIGTLLRTLLQPVEGVQVFCNTMAGALPAIEQLIEHSACRVSGIQPLDINLNERVAKLVANERQYARSVCDDITLYQPREAFHVGFGVFPFMIDSETYNERQAVQPAIIKDSLSNFRCAADKADGKAAAHLIGVEQLLTATMSGGYFAAVLPKKWVGREMKYLRWWQDNAAQVCRIQLPESAVTYTDTKGLSRCAPGTWEFMMWNRPYVEGEESSDARSNRHLLSYAMFRYAPFIFPLETLSFQSIKDCHSAFIKHQWWTDSVRLWKGMLEKQTHNRWCGTTNPFPKGLPDPDKVYVLDPDPDMLVGIRIENDSKSIKKIRNAVHIKATGSSVKLTAYEPAALGALVDFRVSAGPMFTDDEGRRDFAINRDLRMLPYPELKDRLLKGLEEQGLVPCMTASDAHKMKKREKWLAIQLTPMERLIPLKSGAEGQQSDKMEDWEWLYSDIGMKATVPEIMHMWRKRAAKMGMDNRDLTYEYQFEDLLLDLAKCSTLNGNVMGLGKTRQTALVPLGRCADKVLIVCPAKLIGVWQDEIDNCILPYMRRQRKNWQGRVIPGGVNIIEWAKDCLPENLKMFNIISYDRLKSVPRDGRFFKCPRCGTVSFSPYGGGKTGPTCPGDAFLPEDSPQRCNNLIKAWKAGNRGNPELGDKVRKDGACLKKQKYKVLVDDAGNVVRKIHWNDQSFPLENVRIIDSRPPKPSIPIMEEQTHSFKKMIKIQVGETIDPITDAKTPVIKTVKRKSHVAWTFSDILRWRFNHIIADEALYFMNKTAMRSQAMYHVNAKSKWALTGTLIKGYPHKALGILNWTFKRAVFPSYRPYDKGGMARFMRKYKTEVFIGPDKTPKLLPKINNPELFQAEIAPLMHRHTRNEPPVTKDIPRKTVLLVDWTVDMDQAHKDYYQKWLDKFAEWWQKMKEEEEGRGVQPGALLAKLSYLINASTIPHFMLESIMSGNQDTEGKELAKEWFKMIGPYNGPPTAKMLKCRRLIEEGVVAGDKTIVFSIRRRNLDLGKMWCEKRQLHSMIVDGTVPLEIQKATGRSKRHELVEKFRNYDYHCMWAGLGALAEGLNIPEANRGIAMDYPWDPVELKQGFGRMIRPAQTKTVYCNHLIHNGAIDGYMAALCYLKDRSGGEGLDYMEFDDFSTDIIPDIQAYADAILDGPEAEANLKRKMWLAVDEIKRHSSEGEDADIEQFEEGDGDDDE